MATKAIAGLIVVGLAIGVWLLWPRGESASPVSTTVLAAEPSTTGASDTATSATPTSTSVENSESHIVETVEEAEEILRELWFGWFEGIYNQDEDRIREVVATEAMVESAVAAFGAMEMTSKPTTEAISIIDLVILRSDDQCLAVWSTVAATFRPGSSDGVQVARWSEDTWLLMSVWAYQEDLWAGDCDSQLRSSS